MGSTMYCIVVLEPPMINTKSGRHCHENAGVVHIVDPGELALGKLANLSGRFGHGVIRINMEITKFWINLTGLPVFLGIHDLTCQYCKLQLRTACKRFATRCVGPVRSVLYLLMHFYTRVSCCCSFQANGIEHVSACAWAVSTLSLLGRHFGTKKEKKHIPSCQGGYNVVRHQIVN